MEISVWTMTILFVFIFVFFILPPLLIWLMYLYSNYAIERAKEDVKYRNDVASCIYFTMELGPSISSVSVVALLLNDDTMTNYQLLFLFVCGIILKRFGRRAKSFFYDKIEKGVKEDVSND